MILEGSTNSKSEKQPFVVDKKSAPASGDTLPLEIGLFTIDRVKINYIETLFTRNQQVIS